MKQLVRRAQGEVIDFLEQRLGWNVITSQVEELQGHRDDPDVLRLTLTAEFELESGSEYRYDSKRSER